MDPFALALEEEEQEEMDDVAHELEQIPLEEEAEEELDDELKEFALHLEQLLWQDLRYTGAFCHNCGAQTVLTTGEYWKGRQPWFMLQCDTCLRVQHTANRYDNIEAT